MRDLYFAHLRGTLEQIRADGFYKNERVIASPQSADVRLANGTDVLNFCANNYLGLATWYPAAGVSFSLAWVRFAGCYRARRFLAHAAVQSRITLPLSPESIVANAS